MNTRDRGRKQLPPRPQTNHTKDQYRKLRSMVDGDDRACVKAAVATFVGRGQGGGKKVYICCASCKARIELPADE